MERGDWCWATHRRMGRKAWITPYRWRCCQEEYPELATSARLQRVRVLDL